MTLNSLRGRLRWMIVAMLLVVWVPLAIYSFSHTSAELEEMSDGRLAQAAHTISGLVQRVGIQGLVGNERLLASVQKKKVIQAAGDVPTWESEVGFQVFDQHGKLVLGSANLLALPPSPMDRSSYQDLRKAHHIWRVYTYVDTSNDMVIRVAERYDTRLEIINTLWLEHGLPFLLGLPVLALLIGWSVARGLRPLVALASALSSREPGSREPITLNNAPQELQPVLTALNAQLARQEDALERERRFSADVAHELRTPLASIMLNLESAMATNDLSEVHDSLAGAQHSVGTLARRIEQLLALAKLETGTASSQLATVDLMEVAGDVIEELTQVIAGSGVELGFPRSNTPVLVQGYDAALAALLRNLLENALRHVPAGGQVQLAIEQHDHEATLEVIDDGPGIPPERRDAVFGRFHREASSRGEGYGLGLSIVQRAAGMHNASIELLDSPFGKGLRVRVAIPLGA
ncbi:sensor histidine kinase [Dyella humicola]|uniref:sensor histidine kinase n=1 Tax=Dyella humicola TaxID=2992126 RepID=UPI002255D366|nr:ATP-binding protein [Dyella humicola]